MLAINFSRIFISNVGKSAGVLCLPQIVFCAEDYAHKMVFSTSV